MGDKNASDTNTQKIDQLPEGMEAATDANSERDGQSFVNPGTVGSGTITEDGKIGPPAADPNALRGPYVSAGPRTERLRGGDPAPEESGPTDAERDANADSTTDQGGTKPAPRKSTGTSSK